MNTFVEETDHNCAPLHTFQESLQKMFSSRLGTQAIHIATSLPTQAVNRISSLSTTSKTVIVTSCLGAAVWVSLTWWGARRRSRKRAGGTPGGAGDTARTTRRTRTSSFRSTILSSDTGSIGRSYNWAELQRKSVSDQDSVVSTATLVDGTQLAPQQLGLMGMEALETVIGYWEDALGAYNPSATRLVLTTSEECEFRQSIEEILDIAYQLQEMSESMFIHQNSVLNKREEFLRQKQEVLTREADSPSSRKSGRRSQALSVSTLDDVSFVSAEETVADLRDFDDMPELGLDLEKLALYQSALDLYETSGIPYRVMRTEFVGCSSDVDYLAKLHCLRLAFREIMKDSSNREWWCDNGRIILAQLLVKSDKDPKEFLFAYNDLVEYLQEEGVVEQMEEELKSRNVQCINFYDICLDYILIDSFEDLESPPSSVLAVMKNRWLSNGFKESALQTAIWSVFQAKRRLLIFPNGFKAKFYNLSEILTPSLAWGFFGPDEELSQLMNDFKKEVLDFLADIFSLTRVDFSSVELLSKSVMAVAKERLGAARIKLDC